MKKLSILILLIMCCIITGCNKNEKENDTGNLYSFYVQEIEDNYLEINFVNSIDKIILENKYPNEIQTTKEQAKEYLNLNVELHGTEAVYQGWACSSLAECENSFYIAHLRNKYIMDYAKKQITDKEIEKYYNDNIKGDIEIRHILITPDIKDGATENEKKKAEQKAKDTINEIINKLKKAENVEEEFKKLVIEYTDDDSTKDNYGSLGKITWELSENYHELLDVAYKLKDGEFSTSIITTELGYHVILKIKSYEKESLDNLKDKIIETLANDLFSQNEKFEISAMNELRKELGENKLLINIEKGQIYDSTGKSIYRVCIDKKCKEQDYKRIDLTNHEIIVANQEDIYQREIYKYLNAPLMACSDRQLIHVINAYNTLEPFNLEVKEYNNYYVLDFSTYSDGDLSSIYGVLALDDGQVYFSTAYTVGTENEIQMATEVETLNWLMCHK